MPAPSTTFELHDGEQAKTVFRLQELDGYYPLLTVEEHTATKAGNGWRVKKLVSLNLTGEEVKALGQFLTKYEQQV